IVCLILCCALCFHCREEQYITDRCGIGEKHTHSVDSKSDTACRRHTDFQCVEEIFVCCVGLFISLCQKLFLCFEPLSLIDWIIQLRVGIRSEERRVGRERVL